MKEERYRYLVFAYDGYYPSGGSGDVIGKSNNIDECETIYKEHYGEFGEVLDLDTGEFILQFGF
jgi:hypothetical protein